MSLKNNSIEVAEGAKIDLEGNSISYIYPGICLIKYLDLYSCVRYIDYIVSYIIQIRDVVQFFAQLYPIVLLRCTVTGLCLRYSQVIECVCDSVVAASSQLSLLQCLCSPSFAANNSYNFEINTTRNRTIGRICISHTALSTACLGAVRGLPGDVDLSRNALTSLHAGALELAEGARLDLNSNKLSSIDPGELWAQVEERKEIECIAQVVKYTT